MGAEMAFEGNAAALGAVGAVGAVAVVAVVAVVGVVGVVATGVNTARTRFSLLGASKPKPFGVCALLFLPPALAGESLAKAFCESTRKVSLKWS